MKHRHNHIKHKIRNLKPKKLLIQRPLFWVIFLFFLLVLVVVYGLFFWPEFQISNIEILGNQKITTQDLKNLALADINKSPISKSIFMVDTNNLTKDILNSFGVIEAVGVQKKWPQGLTLTIKERVPFAVFCNGKNSDNCFLMDNNGIIFEALKDIPQNMLVVNLESGPPLPVGQTINGVGTSKEFSIGQTAVSKNNVETISKISKQLQDNFQVGIKKVLVADTLVVTTSENWQIYFDQTQDIDTQIIKMNALLKNEIPEATRKNLQYIYLQYKDRAYYK